MWRASRPVLRSHPRPGRWLESGPNPVGVLVQTLEPGGCCRSLALVLLPHCSVTFVLSDRLPKPQGSLGGPAAWGSSSRQTLAQTQVPPGY